MLKTHISALFSLLTASPYCGPKRARLLTSEWTKRNRYSTCQRHYTYDECTYTCGDPSIYFVFLYISSVSQTHNGAPSATYPASRGVPDRGARRFFKVTVMDSLQYVGNEEGRTNTEIRSQRTTTTMSEPRIAHLARENSWPTREGKIFIESMHNVGIFNRLLSIWGAVANASLHGNGGAERCSTSR